MYVIVDVECFYGKDGELVIKELAIVNPVTNQTQSYIFNSPYEWETIPEKFKGTNRWLTRNFHRMQWEEGHIPYAKLPQILIWDTMGCNIYAKGLEKVKMLATIVGREVLNLEKYGCPKLKDINTSREGTSMHRKHQPPS